MTDQQAADAMRAHHELMATTLRQRVAALGAAVQARGGHLAEQSSVLDYLDPSCPEGAGIEGLTQFDEAYLKGLYAFDKDELKGYMRETIVERISEELGPG